MHAFEVKSVSIQNKFYSIRVLHVILMAIAKKKKIYRIYAKGKVKRVKTIITKNQLIIKEGRNKENEE